MGEVSEGGASLAWRLLATLEGGSLILATSALLAYTARNRAARRDHRQTEMRSVLVTNTTNALGKELKRQLEARGVAVSTVPSGEATGAGTIDALVVVGAEPAVAGLDGLSGMLSEDVYGNLKLLDSLSPLVRSGGCMAWACAGSMSGAFSGAAAAFDDALEASLKHAAKVAHCEPIWVGRSGGAERVAERIVAALVPCAAASLHTSRFSIRNTALKVSSYIGRWLKIAS